eukprot:scaffold144926_cov85-Attheya_sp.AAC.2
MIIDPIPLNSHMNVPTRSGPLGTWVDTQQRAFRLLKEGKCSTFITHCERRVKLESIGFNIKTDKIS